MSSRLTENIQKLLQELIVKLSGFERDTENFGIVENFAHSHIDSYHYFFNDNRRDIEKHINGLSEKYHFHGFVGQSLDLKECTKKFFDSSNDDEDLKVRLAIIKFLTEISVSPTTYFSEHPDEFKTRYKGLYEEVNWKKLLTETKVPLKTKYVESTDEEWSDLDDDLNTPLTTQRTCDIVETADEVDTKILNTDFEEDSTFISEPEKTHSDLKISQILKTSEAIDILKKNIQTTWWNQDNLYEYPESNIDEAEVAVRWDQFINHSTLGLCNHTSNIITEYKVMREIIWQFFDMHSCFSFKFINNELVIKNNLTVASIRPVPFKNFLSQFMPYFYMLKIFKDFQNFLLGGEFFTPLIPDTFRSYNCAIEDILKPVYRKIMECEDVIRKQESTYTLLKLGNDLKSDFQKIEILNKIHMKILRHFNQEDDSFSTTTYLLSFLYSGLLNSASKTEQNIYLTLYLESLYKYFTTIEVWLTQDILQDYSDEFIIIDKSKQNLFDRPTFNTQFEVRTCKNFSKNDGMLKIISTTVLQLGKNNHLLKKLSKISHHENNNQNESLHQEYCKLVLQEINKTISKSQISDFVSGKESSDGKHVTIKENLENINLCPEIPKSKSGLDDLKNFIDINDPFLMLVFEKYLVKEEIRKENKKPIPSLYELIDSNVDRLVPVWQILENKFREVLKNRYGVPGLIVKETLINDYNLPKYFSLMRRLFLFEDDIMFPFYKKIFAQFEEGQAWGNFFWLTTTLQDLLMDYYPDFCENCRVDVAQNWRQFENPLDAWDKVSVHFKIDWPINLIIQQNHMTQYLEIFKFILKIKWALYTLNGLKFSDIQSKKKKFTFITPFLQYRIRRLQLMRFRLLNDVSSVQHYILGHLFSSVLKKFNQNVEESCDLDTLVEAHNAFITTMYSFCQKLRDHDKESHGFAKVLTLVKKLQNMWKNITNFSEKMLKECELEYLKCNRYLRPIIQVDILF